MSLQVWLPLNGNLDNKGIADISITNNGATINNGGKIGQCYYFDNTYAYSNLDYSDFGTDFTVAFWYKIDTAFEGNRHLICLANNYGWANLVFTCAATATNQFSFNIGNGNTSSRIITCPYVVGEWQHICFTFKNKNAKIYVNGVFLKSGTYPINPDWTKTQKIGLGGTPAGQEKSSTLYLNDVRVYNHCLSKKEIKEISKGLVLHYNFEDVIVPLNNKRYNVNYSIYNNFSGKCTITLTNTGKFYEGSPIYRETIKVTDSSALLSFQTALHSHGIAWYTSTFDSNQPVVAGILWRPITHNDTQVGGTAGNKFTAKWTKTQPYKDGWSRFNVCRVNTGETSGTDGIYISVCCPSLQLNEELVLEFCQPEEYQNIDYVPIRNRYVQNAERTIYDSSGYEHNGTILSPDKTKFVESEVEGEYCLDVQSTGNYSISTDKIFYDNINQCHTVSFWYKRSKDSIQRAINFNLSYYTVFNTSGNKSLMYINNGDNDHYVYGSIIPLNEWTLVTWVYDHNNGVCKVYYNGVLKNNSGFTPEQIKTRNPYGFADTTYLFSIYGQVDDFRIYATALSANDIKELYEVKGDVTKNGVLMCGNFIEKNTTPILTKTSNFQSRNFIDGYQQLEYISKSEQSQRSYYFDLDLYATDIKRIEADISFDAVAQSGGSYFFGGYFGSQTDGRTSYNAYLYVEKDTNKIGYGCGGDWISSGMVWNLGDRHYIKSQLFSGSQFLEVDGNRILTHTFSHLPPNTSTVPLLIYQYQGSRLANYGWSGKIYSMKIYGNDEKLIRNLIPCCRKSDNQEGLYDMVNNVFYTNEVTGNFSKGEDISKARIFSNSIIANEIIEI